MALKMATLLLLALIICVQAVPLPSPKVEESDEELNKSTELSTPEKPAKVLEIVEIIDTVIVPVSTESTPADKTTTNTEVKQDDEEKNYDHKVVKRSALRGDNSNNDLLAELEGLDNDNSGSSIAGRRIKFLPTWLG